MDFMLTYPFLLDNISTTPTICFLTHSSPMVGIATPFEGYVDSPTTDPEDPYGTATVSGFYDPGS